jgi:hypothetical protein
MRDNLACRNPKSERLGCARRSSAVNDLRFTLPALRRIAREVGIDRETVSLERGWTASNWHGNLAERSPDDYEMFLLQMTMEKEVLRSPDRP